MEFCAEGKLLGLTISANKPSADGFEVQNLIVENQTGFMCESFIRPPVVIKLEFPFLVEIAYINLEAQFKERQSNGFKISTLVYTSNKENSSSDARNHEGMEEFHLGNWFSLVENIIVLKNYNYKHRFPLPAPPSLHKQKSKEVFHGSLRSANRQALSCVRSINLTITGVHPTGSPVLKRLQIWGQPAASSSFSEKKTLFHLWKRIKERKAITTRTFPLPLYSDKSQTNSNDSQTAISNECTIPDEFLDPLTFEIMKLPILLPSGNSIDSFSLERFISEEAKWSRPASDPFTGVHFKENFKPEPNVHLKARIDRFLLVENNIPSSYLSVRGHVLTDQHTPPNEEQLTRPKRKIVDRIPSFDGPSKRIVTVHSLPLTTEKWSPQCSNPSSSVSCASSGSSRTPFHASQTLQKRIKNSHSFSSCPPPAEAIADSTGGVRHSLVRAIGAALGATNDSRNSANLRRVLPISSSSKVQNSPDKFSLDRISSNSLQCPCGNKEGLFYSLRCSHTVCGLCVQNQTGNINDQNVRCGVCEDVTHKHFLCRAHPKSAYAS